MSQAAVAVSLLQSGSLLLTTGFSTGLFIPMAKYPRIALSLHMNMIQHGLLTLATGLLLRQDNLLELSGWRLSLVAGTHYYLWALAMLNFLNSFWGTKEFLTLVYLTCDNVNSSLLKRLEPMEGRLGRRSSRNLCPSALLA
jgi:hypothetical protein